MATAWPGFRLLSNAGCAALWEGSLTPLHKEYVIQILYSFVSFPFANIKKCCPNIEIINPLLQRREEEPDKAIPHIFGNTAMPERPILCLYERYEWTSSNPISDCIPWTSEWLACYEGWRATGEWKGGGHGTERNNRQRRKRRI